MDLMGALRSIGTYAIAAFTTSVRNSPSQEVPWAMTTLASSHVRAFPGPLLAKVSDAYNGYFAFTKRLHLTTIEDHSTYGPVMRHGPNKLLFNSATALHDIYDNDKPVKSFINSAILQASGVYSLFTVIDKEHHRTKRRIAGSSVNERSMRLFEPTMVQQIDLFIKLLLVSAKESTPVNVTERVTYLACDLIALLSLGFPLKLQTDPAYRFMVPGMFCANHLANTRMQWFRLHQLRLFSLLNYFATDTRERYKRLMEKMVKTRLSEDKDARNDLFSIVSNASSEGENIRVSDIWTEAMSFFPAASETPESQRNLMHEAFTPFSIGYRGCAGKAMAYLETSLVIAKTLWYFDFKLEPKQLGKVGGGTPGRTDGRGRPDEYQLYDVIAGEHDGPYLVFSTRDNSCVDL
ncbi:hypothetical protein E0Z10_g9176 [Xylaria hypoxylon]|uniref:Cytochrome P450 n=1 Tax=Xylaria hypoxylon TaxID=37992 RepID=A0A4Z0YK23_9PEZI|nr:hypothetical protein E0Z10_g9176 [Xylaria hypoxylon]